MINHQKLYDYIDRKGWDMEFYSGCVEPGYDDRPVCLANWNDIPSKMFDALERAGISCEWSDEWTSCNDCGKVIRTSPDCYHWQASYIIFNECELVCIECAESEIEDYYMSIENNSRMAVTLPFYKRYPPTDYRYELVKDGFENGFYPGQNDNPQNILAGLLENNPKGKYLFAMTDQGQFDIEFAVYQKNEDSEDKEN